MPYQALLWALAISIGVQYTLHDGLSTQILLITTYNLNLLSARSTSEHRVEAINVQQTLRINKLQVVVLHLHQ